MQMLTDKNVKVHRVLIQMDNGNTIELKNIKETAFDELIRPFGTPAGQVPDHRTFNLEVVTEQTPDACMLRF